MSRFNTPMAHTRPRSAISAESSPSSKTHEGGAGYARDEKSELFLLAVSHMGDGSFYETAPERGQRFTSLIRSVATADPEWIAGFIPWLRDGAQMRTASVIAAAEALKALLGAGRAGGRALVASALQRADEPGELLAYWHAHYGRAEPKPLKRGIADAVVRLYTEYALLKYDTASHGYRFGDVIERVHVTGEHPEVKGTWRGDLYEHAIDRRHNRDNPVPAALRMIQANSYLRARAAEEPQTLLDTGMLKAAGMTWEDALSLAGTRVSKRDLWSALIPVMTYTGLLRNLRNFDEAGVPDDIAAQAAARLADPAQVAGSRQFPFRFLSAYRAAPSLRWAWPLEQALNASLTNVPALPGRTLVLVDRSPSMWFQNFSERSTMPWADAAAVFGAAIALRAEYADLAEFGHQNAAVKFSRAESVLKVVERFRRFDGTDIPSAVRRHFREGFHSRVVIVTDEQTAPGWLPSNGWGYGGMRETKVDDLIPRHVPLYMWNFGGYKHGAAPSGSQNRHTFGGLTDSAFGMIPLLEAGRDARWPWD